MFLPSLRRFACEIVSLLASQVELYNAKKKKADGQAQKKQACQEIINNLIESLTNNIELQSRPLIRKEFMEESLVNRDEMLERMTKMSSSEFKKIFKIKV